MPPSGWRRSVPTTWSVSFLGIDPNVVFWAAGVSFAALCFWKRLAILLELVGVAPAKVWLRGVPSRTGCLHPTLELPFLSLPASVGSGLHSMAALSSESKLYFSR